MTSSSAANVILGFEERLKNFRTITWENNKLLPWIRVKALRTGYDECIVPFQIGNPGNNCWSEISEDTVIKENFDGSPFVEGKFFEETQAKYFTSSGDGNEKEIKILNENGEITWS